MLRYLFLHIFLFLALCVTAQNADLYDLLLKRGLEEQRNGNYTEAIQKWQAALNNLSDLSADKKKKLVALIAAAKNADIKKLPSTPKPSGKPVQDAAYKTVVKHDTIIRVVTRIDTVIREKPVDRVVIKRDTIVQRDTFIQRVEVPKLIYKTDTIVQRINVDRPIYIDRPEPHHPYGKGQGRLMIYNLCSVGTWEVYVDGKYLGLLNSYFSRKFTSCVESQSGVLFKYAISGMHHIRASNGTTVWDIHVQLYEDSCLPVDIPACQ